MRLPGLLRTAVVLFAIAFAIATSVACARKVDNAALANGVREVVTGTPDWVDRSALGKRLWKIEQAFYESRQHLPAWVEGDETTAHWKDLVQQLKYSEAHGLDPAAHPIAEFEQLREQSQTKVRGTRFPVKRIPEMDAKMTYAYLRYAADLLGWTRSPRQVHRNWLTDTKEEDLAARLADAIDKNRVRDSLEELAPTHPQYKGLQAALAQEKSAPGGRAEQIKMNMERWRWAPRDLGDRYILVNVPAYVMQVMEGEQPALSMRVIVGKPEHQTPLFSDEMTYVVFSPYWNIPPDILRNETLPRVARDPDFLRRNNIEVVGTNGEEGEVDAESIDWSDESATRGLRFRQRPGDGAEGVKGVLGAVPDDHLAFRLVVGVVGQDLAPAAVQVVGEDDGGVVGPGDVGIVHRLPVEWLAGARTFIAHEHEGAAGAVAGDLVVLAHHVRLRDEPVEWPVVLVLPHLQSRAQQNPAGDDDR